MNIKTMYILMIALALCIPAHKVQASIDCLDDSHHLEVKYDTGEYYAIADSPHGKCYCPCEKMYPIAWKGDGRGKCWKCHHYRVPKKQVIDNPESYKKIIDVAKLTRMKRCKKNNS
jgi:hypothetical protein